MSDEDLAYISECIVPRENHELIEDASYIALTNERCAQINKQWFDMAEGDKFVIQAKDSPITSDKYSDDFILNNIVPKAKAKDVNNFL